MFSVMAAGWFVESPVELGKWRMGNRCFKKKTGIELATILRRRVFTRLNCEIGGFHPVWFIEYHMLLGFRLCACCRLVAVW